MELGGLCAGLLGGSGGVLGEGAKEVGEVWECFGGGEPGAVGGTEGGSVPQRSVSKESPGVLR